MSTFKIVLLGLLYISVAVYVGACSANIAAEKLEAGYVLNPTVKGQ